MKDNKRNKVNMSKVLHSIRNVIFPNGYKCIICREELSTSTLYSICDRCMDTMPFNNGKTCLRCSEPINTMANYCLHCKNEKPYYKKNISVFLFKYPISSLVRRLKYDNARYLARTLSNFIASEVVKLEANFDVVIPVPLHPIRQKLRGYNQSELLSSALREKLNLNVDTSILVKTRNTRSQARLSRLEREENLLDAFSVTDKSKVKGKTVLLIDDVFTTGTTINECSKMLINAGAKEVYSITLAHANTTKYFNEEKSE